MSNHLKRKHSLEWKKAENVQLRTFLAKFDPSYITKQLAIALAQSTAPYRLVDNIHFKKALKHLNGNYKTPSHQTISRIISSIFEEMVEKMKFSITKAPFVSICCDFWTGKDMRGYLGICASYLEDFNRKNIMIALKYVAYPHTAIRVKAAVEEVLMFYGINGLNDDRLVSISTDNGSNMVAGLSHRALVEIPTRTDNNPEDQILEDLVEGNDQSLQENEEMVVEMSDNEDIEPNDEDFFTEFAYDKRIPCVNHLLNNNIKVSVGNVQRVKDILQKTKAFINKLKGKGVVNDYLRENNLSKLLVPPLTRWQYYNQMCSSLLKIKSHIPNICNLAQTDNLTIDEYKSIEKLNATFEIYSKLILKFEKDNSLVSEVIPGILTLMVELKNSNLHTDFSEELQKDLLKRTKCIFDPISKHFNLIFALATYLDPVHRQYMDIELNNLSLPELKRVVKESLAKICSNSTNQPKRAKSDFSVLDILVNKKDQLDELSK